jgi:hypothetical protein
MAHHIPARRLAVDLGPARAYQNLDVGWQIKEEK